MNASVLKRATVLLAALVLASAAAAQSQSDQEAALRYYDAGKVEYEAGRYQDALAAFEKAYSYSAAPGLLFNIGQCQRKLGMPREALANFRTYLREIPDAPNRAQTLTLISAIEAELADRTAAAPGTAPAAEATPAAGGGTVEASAAAGAAAEATVPGIGGEATAPGAVAGAEPGSGSPSPQAGAARAGVPAATGVEEPAAREPTLHWGWIVAGAGGGLAALAGLGALTIEGIFSFTELGSGEERLGMQLGERILFGATLVGLGGGATGAALALTAAGE